MPIGLALENLTIGILKRTSNIRYNYGQTIEFNVYWTSRVSPFCLHSWPSLQSDIECKSNQVKHVKINFSGDSILYHLHRPLHFLSVYSFSHTTIFSREESIQFHLFPFFLPTDVTSIFPSTIRRIRCILCILCIRCIRCILWLHSSVRSQLTTSLSHLFISPTPSVLRVSISTSPSISACVISRRIFLFIRLWFSQKSPCC